MPFTPSFVSCLAVTLILTGCGSRPELSAPPAILASGLNPQGEPMIPAPGQLLRVGGDSAATAIAEPATDKDSGTPFTRYRSGRHLIDTPLPDGYPAPTPPGAIDLKSYPAVRRAEIARTDNPDGALFGLVGGRNAAFWPLFRHIQNRNIPMTSPVEMDVPQTGKDAPAPAREQWTMSFLYRTADLGPTGPADRGVIVRDLPPLTVLSLGASGSYDQDSIDPALNTLRQWLSANPAWTESGPPRILYYNDPFTNPKWAEVQLPIRTTTP